jgi:hypothetical protein
MNQEGFIFPRGRERGQKLEKNQAGSETMECHKAKEEGLASLPGHLLSSITGKPSQLSRKATSGSLGRFIRSTQSSVETPP